MPVSSCIHAMLLRHCAPYAFLGANENAFRGESRPHSCFAFGIFAAQAYNSAFLTRWYTMKRALILLQLLLAWAGLHADEIDVTQPIRIKQLIPSDYAFKLGIDPSIPDNFVALSKGNRDDCASIVFWGPEGVLKAYFQDESSLSEPIIHVLFSFSTKQIQYGLLDEAGIRKALQQGENIKDLKLDFGHWGNYPYCAVSCLFEEKEISFLYVGTNFEGGTVLMLHLIKPANSSDEAYAKKFWQRFINETKELPEPLLFKAQGQELHPGYTLCDIFGRKVKVSAQRRKSDRLLQFVVFPEDGSVSFEYKNALVCAMGAQWHHGEPLLKIEGAYIVDQGWIHLSMTTSVLIEEVESFTPVNIFADNIFIKEMKGQSSMIRDVRR